VRAAPGPAVGQRAIPAGDAPDDGGRRRADSGAAVPSRARPDLSVVRSRSNGTICLTGARPCSSVPCPIRFPSKRSLGGSSHGDRTAATAQDSIGRSAHLDGCSGRVVACGNGAADRRADQTRALGEARARRGAGGTGRYAGVGLREVADATDRDGARGQLGPRRGRSRRLARCRRSRCGIAPSRARTASRLPGSAARRSVEG